MSLWIKKKKKKKPQGEKEATKRGRFREFSPTAMAMVFVA